MTDSRRRELEGMLQEYLEELILVKTEELSELIDEAVRRRRDPSRGDMSLKEE